MYGILKEYVWNSLCGVSYFHGEYTWNMYGICMKYVYIYICTYLEDLTNDHLGLVEYKSLLID